MITGELKSKIDAIWNDFWTGGIANPMEVIDQLTFLLFIRRLDDLHTLEENKANRLKQPMIKRIFPEGTDDKGQAWDDLRWSRFKNFSPDLMFETLADRVFPFLRNMNDSSGSFNRFMKDARFTIPTAQLLSRVVDKLADIPLDDRDTKGDIYEYMLGKLSSAGTNGQFRTPRHIIKLMVAMMAPTPKDIISDPASGTCGFLVSAAEYMQDKHPQMLTEQKSRDHFNNTMFNGFDFDTTMLRIGTMNMILHGVENPNVGYRDSLSEGESGGSEEFTVILANPPFKGSIDKSTTAKNLLRVVDTSKTELLFLALFIRQLKNGGRAAVVVPDGVLFGASNAHKAVRKLLIDDHRLDAVVKLPSGVFKPYAGVSTAILYFTKTNSGGTDQVWFYDVRADGFSLDDKRDALMDEAMLGVYPSQALSAAEHEKNNLPDVLSRWEERTGTERSNPRTAQSFCVPKDEITANGYDLSPNRYKEVEHEAVEVRAPREIIDELAQLEKEISSSLIYLNESLK